jgi:hypothetical protein
VRKVELIFAPRYGKSLASKGNDLGAVIAAEITDAFKEIWPEDPCKGDFALFGYGVTH